MEKARPITYYPTIFFLWLIGGGLIAMAAILVSFFWAALRLLGEELFMHEGDRQRFKKVLVLGWSWIGVFVVVKYIAYRFYGVTW